jgi:protoporphyrinogen oxidase
MRISYLLAGFGQTGGSMVLYKFMDKLCSAYRIGNFSLFSENLSQKDKELLYIEVAISNLNKRKFPKFETVASEFHNIGLIEKHSVELIDIININPAYAVYTLEYNKIISEILSNLGKFNIFMAGRHARWKYDSMDGAIKDGIEVAKNLLKIIRRKIYV